MSQALRLEVNSIFKHFFTTTKQKETQKTYTRSYSVDFKTQNKNPKSDT